MFPLENVKSLSMRIAETFTGNGEPVYALAPLWHAGTTTVSPGNTIVVAPEALVTANEFSTELQ